MSFVPPNYYEALAKVESAGNPNARARTSSASGLYQFTKGTWTGLGYDWDDVFNVGKQQEAIQEFTNRNVVLLSRQGIPITGGSLYAAHFLGGQGALNVYGASRDTPLSSIVSPNVIKANSFLKGMSVGDFINWSEGKISKASGGADKVVSGLKSIVSGSSGGGSSSGGSSNGPGSTSDLQNRAVNAATVFASTGNPFLAAGAALFGGNNGEEKEGGLISWLKNLFSVSTFSRVIAVIIGIILIAIAVFFLTGTDKIVVETGKTALKAAI